MKLPIVPSVEEMEAKYAHMGIKPFTPERELAWKRKCEQHLLEDEQRTLKYKTECARENKVLGKLALSVLLGAMTCGLAIPAVWLSDDED